MEERNFVIEYEDWDSYNSESKEKAVEMFKKDHPSATILEIKM